MSLPHEFRVTARLALALAAAILLGDAAPARAQVSPPADSGPIVDEPVVPQVPDVAGIPPAPGANMTPPPVPPGYATSVSAPFTPVVEPSAPVVASLRADDAHADHVILGPTAFTAPRGSIYFSNYELFAVQAGVAVTDKAQITLTTLLPLLDGQPLFADFSAKYAFLRLPRFHMAGIASALVLADGGLTDTFPVGRASVVATGCITANCYVAASASAMLWLTSEAARVVPLTLNVGLSARLVGVFSLLAEANFLAAAGELGGARVAGVFERGALIGYGMRFSSSNFGFDLTFVKPLLADSSPDFLVLGLPWLAFTYRTDAVF